LFLENLELAEAIKTAGQEHLDASAIADAKASAALMAMNTVYYRSKHMIGKDAYNQRQAQLRMTRMGKPATDRSRFELASFACAALAGCEACLKSHEQGLVKEGVSEDQIHDALRIAAVVKGFETATAASKFSE